MTAFLAVLPEPLIGPPAIRLAILVVCLLAWLALCVWTSRDAKQVGLPPTTWSGAMLGSGLLGVLLWLVLPIFVLGLLFYVVLAGGAVAAYIVVRNGKSEPEDRFTFAQLLARMKGGKSRQIQLLMKVKLYDSAQHLVYPPDLTGPIEIVQAYNDVQTLLNDVLWRRASEVDVIPGAQEARVMYVIDGVTTEQPPLPLARSEAVIDYLKTAAGMDVGDRRRPQKGPVSIDVGERKADMEVLAAGTVGGQRLQIRVLEEVVRTNIDELGMPADMIQWVRGIVEPQQGILIVSGPPASGVTSTMYSIVKMYDAFMNHVVAVERQHALELENVTQQPYEDAKLPRILEALVERGLDVLMLDNCSSAGAAEVVIRLAAEKPVVLGMQATDTFVALTKWVKAAGKPQAAVANLKGVLCQVLLRKLCPDCRQPYKPDLDRLAKLNLPADKVDVFYNPLTEPELDKRGEPIICPTCQGTGYRGRTAAYELLEMNDEVRSLIVSGATIAQIRSACRRNKMLYLQEQAMRKVMAGVTSIQEVIRITQQQQQPASKSKAPASAQARKAAGP
jgi:type II secretory ATPase GspE/PulE/Tfp pilus assembly ATPase PilB-like protein